MAKGKDMLATIGPWAYIIGLLIAVLAGVFAPGNTTAIWGLMALGLLVGLANVTEKEVMLFLVASLAFLLSASSLGSVFSVLPTVADLEMGKWVAGIMSYLVAFTAPAAAIVALKALYEISKSA